MWMGEENFIQFGLKQTRKTIIPKYTELQYEMNYTKTWKYKIKKYNTKIVHQNKKLQLK